MDDLNEIVNLLMVVDKARQWPRLQRLHDMAMQRLEKLQAEMVEDPTPAKRWGDDYHAS